uniref:Uncharacterized protein n=1 Tax=Zea mays TaxID=4577 RepID=C4J2C3_MAIZE|nr:unknown [Zea mays]
MKQLAMRLFLDQTPQSKQGISMSFCLAVPRLHNRPQCHAIPASFVYLAPAVY